MRACHWCGSINENGLASKLVTINPAIGASAIVYCTSPIFRRKFSKRGSERMPSHIGFTLIPLASGREWSR